MEWNLAYLLPENLYRVFNATDLNKRKGAIADLWDEDGIFIEPDGIHQGPEDQRRCHGSETAFSRFRL